LPELITGRSRSLPYTLDDMADDAAGLLEALGISAAHLVGLSMGGMIAQAFALRHPEKTLSLCSIMSTTGGRDVGQPTPEAMAHLVRPSAATPEECVEAAVASHRLLGSPAYPTDEGEVRAAALRRYERSHYPDGTARQLCAILASGDRTERLAEVTAPTVVVHGADDALIQASGGRATAEAIPGAELVVLEGMGHDLPAALWPRIVEAIVANATRAQRGRPGGSSTAPGVSAGAWE
jgi:pimeloyl-ACP methyl ester carboxylesterase